jgi:hypothetical protein
MILVGSIYRAFYHAFYVGDDDNSLNFAITLAKSSCDDREYTLMWSFIANIDQ